MNTTTIQGSHINLDNLKDVKSQKALKATDIFSHLPEEEQVEAYAELWNVLKPESKKETPPPAIEAANAAAGGDTVTEE